MEMDTFPTTLIDEFLTETRKRKNDKSALLQSFEALEQENQVLRATISKADKSIDAKNKMLNGLRETVELQNEKIYQLQVQLNSDIPMITRNRMESLNEEVLLLKDKLAVTEQRFQAALKHIPFDQHLAIYNCVPTPTSKHRRKR